MFFYNTIPLFQQIVCIKCEQNQKAQIDYTNVMKAFEMTSSSK